MRLPAPHSGAATYTYSSGSAQFKKRRRSCMSKCLRAERPLRLPASHTGAATSIYSGGSGWFRKRRRCSGSAWYSNRTGF